MIVAGARTPIGRLNGSLGALSGSDLGGIAIKAAVERAGISSDQVQYVIMGAGTASRRGARTCKAGGHQGRLAHERSFNRRK